MLKVKVSDTDVNQILDMVDSDEKLSTMRQEYELNLVENSVDDSVINVILKKKEEKRTFSDLKKIILRKQIDDAYTAQLDDFNNNYVEFVPDHNHDVELEEFDNPRTYYEKGEDGKIYQRWTVEKNNKSLIKDKINSLKDELSSTDYKIIKAYEAKVTLSDSPYSAEELEEIVQQRQAIRDKINELEELIK
jgi:hypothetical protein